MMDWRWESCEGDGKGTKSVSVSGPSLVANNRDCTSRPVWVEVWVGHN